MSDCELCERDMGKVQFHHLIPKQLHSKKKFLRGRTKQFLNSHGIYICKDCHKQIHKLFSHSELGTFLNTLKLLLENAKIQKYLVWIKKQKRYKVFF